MISKVESVGLISNNNRASHVQKAQKSIASNSISNSTNLMGASSVGMFQAMNRIKLASTINFKGADSVLTPTELSYFGKEEFRIPNLLEMTEPVAITHDDTPEDKEHLNTAGLLINFTDEKDGFRKYDIKNEFGDQIAILKAKKGVELPEFTYKQGKFMPEITIKATSGLRHRSIKCLAGSKVTAKDFQLVMPGEYQANPDVKHAPISFTGRTIITTLNKEDKTVDAVNRYFDAGYAKNAVKGDYYEEFVETDPTIVIPAGGFGERFKNITRDSQNKPSEFLPTNDNFRLIGFALNAAASAGGCDDVTKLNYLSQKHEIDESDSVYHVNTYKTDGGAIAEGLARGIIPNDKDMIIINADICTNADITRTLHKLHEIEDAALVIPYYPADHKRAKSFGLMGVEKDENGNLEVKAFIEKPSHTKFPPRSNEFSVHGDYDKAREKWKQVRTARNPQNHDEYLANPGMYFLNPQAVKVLMACGIMNSARTGLGPHVMPTIVSMALNGKLRDEEGRELKVYTVPLEAKGGEKAVWDDLGTAEAYLSRIKDIGHETRKNGVGPQNKYYGIPDFVLNDFKDNTDPETGIVYDSDRAKEVFVDFKKQFEITEAYGNIYVASNDRIRSAS